MTERNYKRDKRSPVPKNPSVSELMSKIKGQETKPEMLLRKALFSLGARGYRKNYKKLPGKPDIVFTKKKVAIFINGCFWHGCEACGWKPPKHNTAYWSNKIMKNKERDAKKAVTLRELGYEVLVVWDHELKQNLTGVAAGIIELIKD